VTNIQVLILHQKREQVKAGGVMMVGSPGAPSWMGLARE
jgi:hypothetical protein